jgi:hypothetical protein
MTVKCTFGSTSSKHLFAGAAAVCAILAAPGAHCGVVLQGEITETSVSGYHGTRFTVGDPDSATHALYAISSRERSDNPCVVTVQSEDLNVATRDSTSKKDLCGPKGATSSELSVQFGDSGANGEHAFITGLQVCMNNDKTRVKGLRIQGNAITAAGAPAALGSGGDCSEVFDPHKIGVQDGSMEYRLCGGKITQPVASRTNCDEKDGWMNWARCPAGALATGATLHFEAGDTPRSLVGIALLCRPVAAETSTAQSR